MRAYARMANDNPLEMDAAELRLRARQSPSVPRLPRTPIGLPTPYRPPLRFAERTI